jgi:alkanesulfonate monooxygenase SsuD/methylene tetrahydromethanopterin reductase-like flavin-dependent oxidoreductase (luciferase family)
MKVGAILMSQNSDEYLRPDLGVAPHPGSSQFFREEFRTGELATSLGFDSIWNVEHHFTAHGETPAPLQQLTYFAGRGGVDVGTAVVVLPWNDPVRVAEQISVLDNLMPDGHRLTVGFGRGSAQPEFDGFQVPLRESNERFAENWEIIRRLLTEEDVSYEGRWRSFEHITVLPRPRHADLMDEVLYSWGSHSSMEFAASAGFVPLFVARSGAEQQKNDMVEFNEIRAKDGRPPVQPTIALNLFVDDDPVRAEEEGRRYLENFYATTLDHYQRLDAEHFKEAGNYAETAKVAEQMASRDRDELLTELAGIQICGTPAEALEELEVWRQAMDPSRLVFSMRFGGMPYDVAERNIRKIAELLPELHSWPGALEAEAVG